LDEAEQSLVQALSLLGWASWMELHGFIILASLLHQRGNTTGTQETLQRMSRQGPQHAACSEALQVLFALRESPGNSQVSTRAKNWAGKFVPHPGSQLALGIGPYHSDAEYFCNLAWSRVQIVLGNFQAAASFIAPALKSANDHGIPFRIVELSIEYALILQGFGKAMFALTYLNTALEIAEQAGYLRMFDHSPQLDQLLQQAIDHNRHSAYANHILLTLNRLDNRSSPPVAVPHRIPRALGLVDPLSDREIEVLKLLASGLSSTEIAQRLVLSPNTLKAHTQNIYSKLDVHSRVQAINKAHELGII
jgi:ATP/maltotriose-dependent transcriptional regulator MalT